MDYRKQKMYKGPSMGGLFSGLGGGVIGGEYTPGEAIYDDNVDPDFPVDYRKPSVSPMRPSHPILDTIFGRGQSGAFANQFNANLALSQYADAQSQAAAQQRARTEMDLQESRNRAIIDAENARAANAVLGSAGLTPNFLGQFEAGPGQNRLKTADINSKTILDFNQTEPGRTAVQMGEFGRNALPYGAFLKDTYREVGPGGMGVQPFLGQNFNDKSVLQGATSSEELVGGMPLTGKDGKPVMGPDGKPIMFGGKEVRRQSPGTISTIPGPISVDARKAALAKLAGQQVDGLRNYSPVGREERPGIILPEAPPAAEDYNPVPGDNNAIIPQMMKGIKQNIQTGLQDTGDFYKEAFRKYILPYYQQYIDSNFQY